MIKYTPSVKQSQLIAMYKTMVHDGYRTSDNQYVHSAFNDMEIRAFKDVVAPLFKTYNINTLLDYGAGGSDYAAPGFSENLSAQQYFELEEINLYEPARGIDQRKVSDAVVCFDVLEHVYILDIPDIILELFSYTNKLLVVNVACYPARALLPNGENAHITVRTPEWWKGQFDACAVRFPNVSIQLYCSTGWRKVTAYQCYRAGDWETQDGFITI